MFHIAQHFGKTIFKRVLSKLTPPQVVFYLYLEMILMYRQFLAIVVDADTFCLWLLSFYTSTSNWYRFWKNSAFSIMHIAFNLLQRTTEFNVCQELMVKRCLILFSFNTLQEIRNINISQVSDEKSWQTMFCQAPEKKTYCTWHRYDCAERELHLEINLTL